MQMVRADQTEISRNKRTTFGGIPLFPFGPFITGITIKICTKFLFQFFFALFLPCAIIAPSRVRFLIYRCDYSQACNTWETSGAPNDGFLSYHLKHYFRLSGVPLKLCRFILGCAIIFLSLRSFKGNVNLFEITRACLSISRKH